MFFFKKDVLLAIAHILIWAFLAFAMLMYQPLTWDIKLPYQFWVKQGVILLLMITAFYLNTNFLVPKLLLKQHHYWFIVALIVLVFATLLLGSLADNVLNLREHMRTAFPSHRIPKKKPGFDQYVMMMCILVLGISTSIKVIQHWYKDSQSRQLLEKEKISSELLFLKAQIHPHFFFNTLNNIYALTLIDGDKSREAIHKLSRMMRYLLYETEYSHTSLSKEISFINDYVTLMKLRLTEKVSVEVNYPISTTELVAPMLFLPFVENAFKHGIHATQASHIHIAISVKQNLLHLKVENSYFEKKKELAEDDPHGIGLANTNRRLDLLYPGKYQLTQGLNPDKRIYMVDLIIQLS